MHHEIRVCNSEGWKQNWINPAVMPEVLRVAYVSAGTLARYDAVDTVVFASIETAGGVIEFGPMYGKQVKLVFTADFGARKFQPEVSSPRWITMEAPYGPDEDGAEGGEI
jgi:hypothetical protein